MTDDRLMELDTELKNIQWDIIGISEVRRKSTELATLRNGHLFYHVGNDDSQALPCLSAVSDPEVGDPGSPSLPVLCFTSQLYLR